VRGEKTFVPEGKAKGEGSPKDATVGEIPGGMVGDNSSDGVVGNGSKSSRPSDRRRTASGGSNCERNAEAKVDSFASFSMKRKICSVVNAAERFVLLTKRSDSDEFEPVQRPKGSN